MAGDGLSRGGRHRGLLAAHGGPFGRFGVIGGVVFAAGLALQAAMTNGLHVPSLASYGTQAVVSVEASFLLNRRYTWYRRCTKFWPSLLRFNVAKTVTIVANLVLYAGLIRLGLNYLLANVLLTVVFAVVNYVGGDRFVFTREKTVAEPPPGGASARRAAATLAAALPTVSVVIPCQANEKTIRAAVNSLIAQDYPGLREIILVGSRADSTWAALEGLRDPRLVVLETQPSSGIRDANFKRDVGIRRTSGDLVSLIDSDMVLPHNWLSRAVTAIVSSEADCVAGVMRSIHDSFWGRFTDNCRLGAKTPRVQAPYFVTAEKFGRRSRKPPITANVLFTREVYQRCPIDASWSHGSLEDYEWFWRVVDSGHRVLVTDRLYGWHHHRTGLRRLAAEYRRSARGCAYFIRAHRRSPFARKRLAQAVTLPLAVVAALAGLAAAIAVGHERQAAAFVSAGGLAAAVVLCGREFARTRTLESLAYPLPALVLGTSYTVSLVTHLIRTAPAVVHATRAPQAHSGPARSGWLPRPRLRHPLTAILAVQAGLSLSLMQTNTAFTDEANYLSLGRELIGHWLHGSPWRSQYAHSSISGSAFFYPPLGAVADSLGGLTGARTLSLIFMLGSTALLYSAASRLFDAGTGAFAAALWAAHSPTIQLGAFATFDAMSVSFTAFAGWLVVQARYRDHRGELVALSAVALALANLTAFSGIAVDPLVIAFAFLVWLPGMGGKRAISCTAWLAAGCAACFCLTMTVTRCWAAIVTTVFSRDIRPGASASPLHVLQDSWTYTGLIMILAVIGMIAAISTGVRSQWMLAALLAFAAVMIPVAQAHEGTAVSLKKHLAYGAWFVVIGAACGCRKITQQVSMGRMAAAACCTVALTYPAVNGWWSAWAWYHSWHDADSLIAAERSILPEVAGDLYLSPEGSDVAAYVSRYYLAPTGNSWERFISATPAPADLRRSSIGAIVLVFPTSVSPPRALPSQLLLSTDEGAARKQLLTFLGSAINNSQLGNLVTAIQKDQDFRLAAVGPYDSKTATAKFAIWVRK